MVSRLTRSKIDPAAILQDAQDGEAGATVLFIGTVRDHSEAGKVDRIRYEAYSPMAEKKLLEIEEEVNEMWPTRGVRMVHRVGELKVGEVSVAVAVSASHRAEAFEACRHAIERIKHDVPIWKKERLVGGAEVWVEGKPMQGNKRRRGHTRARRSSA